VKTERGHAVVVGASSGIGAASVRELAKRGWSVSALARRDGPAEAARSIACDVTDDDSVRKAWDELVHQAGVPAVLVYSAGTGVAGRTLDVPQAAAREMFEVNFWGFERTVRHALPPMKQAGRGAIVLVSSIAATRAVAFEAHYAASKAACARFLESVALEAAEGGVHLGWVAPGYVPTGFLERATFHGMDAPAISGSGVTSDDVARAVVDLAEKRRSRTVLGWRENAITIADRLLPGAYDRLLRARVRRA